jgi:hypothetical protein
MKAIEAEVQHRIWTLITLKATAEKRSYPFSGAEILQNQKNFRCYRIALNSAIVGELPTKTHLTAVRSAQQYREQQQ